MRGEERGEGRGARGARRRRRPWRLAGRSEVAQPWGAPWEAVVHVRQMGLAADLGPCGARIWLAAAGGGRRRALGDVEAIQAIDLQIGRPKTMGIRVSGER